MLSKTLKDTGSEKLSTLYLVPSELCTPYSQSQVPHTFETMYPELETIRPVMRNLTNKWNNPSNA